MGKGYLRCCMGLMEGYWALREPREKPDHVLKKAAKGFSGYYQALIQGRTSLPQLLLSRDQLKPAAPQRIL